MNRRTTIFQSVFPAAVPIERPTPASTPQIDTGSFQQSQGTNAFHDEDDEDDDVATRQIRWERAWHVATTAVTLPSSAFTFEDLGGTHDFITPLWTGRWRSELRPALSILAAHESLVQSHTKKTDGSTLFEWYEREVTRHFTEFQMPLLEKVLSTAHSGRIESDFEQDGEEDTLMRLLQLLERLQAVYQFPVEKLIMPQLGEGAQQHGLWFREYHHAIVAKSMASTQFYQCLFDHLRLRVSFVFANTSDAPTSLSRAVAKRVGLLASMLNKVGLGGAQSQRAFAETFDELVSVYIRKDFSWPNISGSGSDGRLPTWVREVVGPFASEIEVYIRSGKPGSRRTTLVHDGGETESWIKRAVHELAAQRLTEAFGIIVTLDDEEDHPTASLAELAPLLHTAAGRAHVAAHLIKTIHHRLLIPSAATVEILRVYVNLSVAFLEVDRSGLLLARLLQPIRRYLREREDTVRLIVRAFLFDCERALADEDEAMRGFAQLVQELYDPAPAHEAGGALFSLEWEPDPVDAMPEWKAEERPEIFSKLMDIFENKDVFVKEFQAVLGETLLRSSAGGGVGAQALAQEIRVLELFKAHIGEASLQACEVMLRDISDARRTNEAVRKDQALNASGPPFFARVLSRFYWPDLDREHMLIPRPVELAQARYAASFEAYKPSRKLTWLQNLGSAQVELHLRDRIVTQSVPTWQASVIYAFDGDGDGDGPTRKTAKELVDQLQMDDELVDAALAFWVARRVLRSDSPYFVVLEELPAAREGDADNAVDTAQAGGATASSVGTGATGSAPDATVGVRKRDKALAEEKMAIFWQYTVNMLTNQGPMPLQRIIMMLKLVVPGGLPYSNDEFRNYLAGKVEDGKLEVMGGNYKIIK